MKCLSCSHSWRRKKLSEYFSFLSTCPNCGSRFVARNDIILLAYGFFKRLFDSELPFEITLFVSFVVMMNAGYFTFMFILSILRAPKLI